jgi:hypothetical protein
MTRGQIVSRAGGSAPPMLEATRTTARRVSEAVPVRHDAEVPFCAPAAMERSIGFAEPGSSMGRKSKANAR